LKDKLLTAYLIVTQDNNIMYCLVWRKLLDSHFISFITYIMNVRDMKKLDYVVSAQKPIVPTDSLGYRKINVYAVSIHELFQWIKDSFPE
jgi:hypothetical protein